MTRCATSRTTSLRPCSSGGTEKLRGGDEYGVPLAAGLDEAIAEHRPEVVLDLSDEPVLDPPAALPPREPRARPRPAVRRRGLPLRGAGAGSVRAAVAWRSSAPASGSARPRSPGTLRGCSPATGAWSSWRWGGEGRPSRRSSVSRRRSRRSSSCRGAVATPRRTTSRRPRSPASRRSAAGAAAAGSPAPSGSRTCTRARARGRGARAGARPLRRQRSRGAAGRDAARRVLVVGGPSGPGDRRRLPEHVSACSGPTSSCSPWPRWPRAGSACATRSPPRRPPCRSSPSSSARSRWRPCRAGAWRSSALRAHPGIETHLREQHGADVVHVSGNLADRDALRAELAGVDADVWLVELKAAAVDVVAEAGLERGVEVLLARNDVAAGRGRSRRRAAPAGGRGRSRSERAPPLPGPDRPRRRGRPALLEGPDGTGADGVGRLRDERLRARPARGARPRRPRRGHARA